LTVLQPWAWAIVHGTKRVENRSWFTRYRGPLLIHAGKGRQCLGDALDLLADAPPPARLAFGAAVGVAELIGCIRVEDHDPADPWAFGPWCWLLRDPRPLAEPVPMRGSLGLFAPPSALAHLFA
jgi:hypothetical protein